MNIPKIIQNQKDFFNTHTTKDMQYRLAALKKLKANIITYELEITEALKQDLGKHSFESYTTEIGLVLHEISTQIKNLKGWEKPKRVKTPLMHFPSQSKIYKEPLGTVLVIAPWNYPFQLALTPLIGAIAAGNTVIVKPSELASHTAAVIQRLIENTFSPHHVICILGDAQVVKSLLEYPLDHIFFTGSTRVGKLIMEQASQHVTPVTLELGGKSPCIVDDTANLKLAAKRIVWGKFTNAGQTCIAPDYLLVEQSTKENLMTHLKQAIIELYTDNALHNESYSHIISPMHFKRLASLIDEEAILFGGKTDANHLRIEPTLVSADWSSQIMKDEIFGPILPILEYSDIDLTLQAIQARPKPLALYLFTNNKHLESKILSEVSSGSACVNDTLIQFSNPHLPFGGVGDSGMGAYHGYHSFNTFSHSKGVMKKSVLLDIPLRYPQFKETYRFIKKILK